MKVTSTNGYSEKLCVTWTSITSFCDYKMLLLPVKFASRFFNAWTFKKLHWKVGIELNGGDARSCYDCRIP